MKGMLFWAASPLVQLIGPVGDPRVNINRLVGLVRTWPAVAPAISLGDPRSRKSTCRCSPLFAYHGRLFWLHVLFPLFDSVTV